MRKFLIATVIGVAALSGCTTEVVREVPVTQAPVETRPAPTGPSSLDYINYLDHVNSQSFAAMTVSDAELTNWGDGVCTALDSGDSFADIVEYLGNASPNMSNDDAALVASVLWAAVTYLCPEYESEMSAYINGGGI